LTWGAGELAGSGLEPESGCVANRPRPSFWSMVITKVASGGPEVDLVIRRQVVPLDVLGAIGVPAREDVQLALVCDSWAPRYFVTSPKPR
jgi:hypothetical protein